MSRLAAFFVFNICLLNHVFSEDKESKSYRGPPYVSVETGTVKGHLIKGADYSYMAYRGIPYAAPPVGQNRFKAPLPAVPWPGVLEANRTAQCPQVGVGDEDCLLLNVFTPAPHKHSQQHLPVLVFIHGGAFYLGTAPTQGVEYLLKHDVIVVTFNYRIGVLGFLCLGTEEVPGNAGMKDQVAALQWVQRNIGKFGGHPRKVTIYGTSAGGASVDLHVLSKMSNGLFRSAIAESGSATSTWPIDINPIATATKLAETLDFIPQNIEELTKFYQSKAAEELTIASAEYHHSIIDGSVGFAPCIETNVSNVKPFITESPYDILTQIKYDKIQMMLIYSTLEGLFLKSSHYYENNYKERMETNFEYFLPADLVFETEEEKKYLAEEIKEFYFGNKTIDDDSIVQYLEYLGDCIIMHGVLTSAELYSKHMPVYLMEFSYKGGLKNYDTVYNNVNVAGHSAASRHAIVTSPITNFSDMRAVEKVAEIITNFVKFGNPTPHPSPSLPASWPPVDPEMMNFLLFGEDLKFAEKPHWNRKLFWDRIYELYRRR